MIFALTFPLIVLFVVGIPLVAFIALYVNRHKIEFENFEFKERFGFLYNGYKSHFWFWEFVVVARKVLLVAVSVYFSDNQNVQALMAVFLCTCALTAHSAARPFNHTTLNVMELLSLLTSFFTFFFGQFLFISIGNNYKIAASVIVLFVNISYILLVIAIWIYWFTQKIDRLKAKQAKKKAEKEAAKKVPWSESDWRFHLENGTTDWEAKELEHVMHSADAPVNGVVQSADPLRAPRASVVAMNASAGNTTLPRAI